MMILKDIGLMKTITSRLELSKALINYEDPLTLWDQDAKSARDVVFEDTIKCLSNVLMQIKT
jgi:hypothetical protein